MSISNYLPLSPTRYLTCSQTYKSSQCGKTFTPKNTVYYQKRVNCTCISCDTHPEWISSAQKVVGKSCLTCRSDCRVSTDIFTRGVPKKTRITEEQAAPTIPQLDAEDIEENVNMNSLIETTQALTITTMKQRFRQNKRLPRRLDNILQNIETKSYNIIKKHNTSDYCYLCGFIINDDVDLFKMEIEHPFAIKLLASMFGAPDLNTVDSCIKRLFAINFLPSHRYCNQVKSQQFFVKWNENKKLEPDLNEISYFLQKLINGSIQPDGTNRYSRPLGTTILKDLITSQNFHADPTKNRGMWAIQRYLSIIKIIQEICDIVNINNTSYTSWVTNIQEQGWPSPDFTVDQQQREIVCKYERQILQNYKKQTHTEILNTHKTIIHEEVFKKVNERRASLRGGTGQRMRQHGGANFTNQINIIEENQIEAKILRTEIWNLTQEIYELIGANVENIFSLKGITNVTKLEQAKNDLKRKQKEVVEKMNNICDNCMDIFERNLDDNEDFEPSAYQIYNDETINKLIFTDDWNDFTADISEINPVIHAFLISKNAIITIPFNNDTSPSAHSDGIRSRRDRSQTVGLNNTETGGASASYVIRSSPSSTSPVVSSSPMQSPSPFRSSSTSPAQPPAPATSVQFDRKGSFNEEDQSLLLINSAQPARPASRGGILRYGAGAAAIAAAVAGAGVGLQPSRLSPAPFTRISTPIPLPGYIDNGGYRRTRKRKNLKRKTRKYRK